MSYYDDGRAPSVTGSATSKAAADSVDGNTLREKVDELIEHRSPSASPTRTSNRCWAWEPTPSVPGVESWC